ncbi:MAG: V-type ATP synthase subunit D [Actinobacteria bacterium]|nr:V-type ATP synthase subunit D [Actinomycetota bacterium]
MILNINATRMELLRLKKRLQIAQRGHKLLKDKRDELMRQLLSIIDEVKNLRFSIEKEFQSILESFMLAKAEMGPFQMEQELLLPTKTISVSVEQKNLMSVHVPVYTREVKGDIISYGYFNTSGELDVSLIKFDEFIESLLALAEKEKTVQLLANEIEETRRRVNALEYKLIPNLIETIKSITMKLSETELANTVRLMKIKDMVRSH